MNGLILLILAVAGFQEPAESPRATLSMTSDPDVAGRCLNGMAGFSGVRMRCMIDDEGRGRDCVVANPNPRIMRHERVFQCMASAMRFSMSDGSSPGGQRVEFGLNGRSVLSEEELRQHRAQTRQ